MKQKPQVERRSIYFAFLLLGTFLAADAFIFSTSRSSDLVERRETLLRGARIDDSRLIAAIEAPKPLADLPELAVSSSRNEFEPRAFFSDEEVAFFERRRSLVTDAIAKLAPPLGVHAERAGLEVSVKWEGNPANARLSEAEADGSLPPARYELHRWRDGEDPALVATMPLDTHEFVDRAIGLRAERLHYSVRTVLKERIGDVETLIQSSDAASIELALDELFEVSLIEVRDGKAVVEVTVPTETERRSHQFEVDKGAKVGSILRLDGSEVDFQTGLTLEVAESVETSSERKRRVPVFNPDGSQGVGESGYLFRDDVRKVPIRRMTVRLRDAFGRTRDLSRDVDIASPR